VIREASAAAVAAAEHEPTIDAVMGATTTAAHKAVAKTPSLLAILRQAGVVDSGGQGLFRLFEGANAFLTGDAKVSARLPGAVGVVAAAAQAPDAPAGASAAHAGAPPGAGMRDEGFGFETMFLAQAAPDQPLDVDAIRSHYESIGESVLVAGDARAIKVHIHNERPDLVLAYALGLGQLSKISVENLDQQASDVRETRAAAFAADAAPASGRVSEAGAAPIETAAHGNSDGTGASAVGSETLPLAVVAVAAGEGLAAIFRDFGVQRVVHGGQSANPSTGELLEAVKSLDAREILLLPNNPNVVLAARQVTTLVERPVAVVATRNAAEGFAAMLALDPDKSAADNAVEMTAAGRAVQSLAVTQAVRDATVSGRKVKKGQTIALDPDDGLVAVANDPDTAVLNAVRKLNPGFELITVYYGDGGDLAATEALARRIHDLGTGAEVEVLHGGQPHYRYLISAE
jgi:DAK2 domain fusion protein YloV